MTEYKRWMAYLYHYENGFKKNCVGTARIERRGSEARTTVSVQLPSMANECLKNYFYFRTPEGLRGIFVGEYATSGAAGNWQSSMDADNMGESGLLLECMDGYLICKDSAKYYASTWDDKPLLPTEVYELLQGEEESPVLTASDRVALPFLESEFNDVEPKMPLEEQTTLVEEKALILEEPATYSSQEDLPKEEELLPSVWESASAERIFELCPVIWPFSKPWTERCVKLELEDIGLLPAKHWQLTTNSFLMHSYYGYRHLVLARVRDGGCYRYELLVPGIYNEREKEIAGLFGFQTFHNTKSRPIVVGEYGYWSMPVVFS